MYKVIIVDDEILARVGIRSLIQWGKYGFEIAGEAENGQEALALAHQLKPDIIITDIKMPVMNGVELIKALRDEKYDVRFVVLSSYNDFDFVREAMKFGAEEYMLKLQMEPEKLLETLIRLAKNLDKEREQKKELEKAENLYDISMPLVKEKFFKDLIFGSYGNSEEVENQVKFLNIPIRLDNLICVAVHVENPDIYKKFTDDDIYTLNNSIVNIISQVLSRYNGGYVCHIEKMEFVIIYPVSDIYNKCDIHEDNVKIANSLNQALKKYVNMSVAMGFSNVCHGYADIKLAYQQAAKALSRCFSCPGTYFVEYPDVHGDIPGKAEDEVFSVPMDELVALEKAFDAGDIEETSNVIGRIRKSMSSNRSVTKESIRGVCSALVCIINSFASSCNIPLTNIWGEGYDPYKYIDRLNSVHGYVDWISELQDKVLGKLCENNRYRAVIVKAKRYISERYHEDISLGEVAQYLSLSANYFSGLFKKETGENFSDYITNLRVERSKELLKSSEYKIYEVAKMVGYDSEYYFSRTFKKVTGISPIQYKNNKRIVHE